MLRNHKDLDVWKKSMTLVLDTYKMSKSFPKSEIYGLASQMRRSAVSIPSNIAEGAARKSRKEFNQFLYIALGSLAELETQIIIACQLGYIEKIQSFEEDIRDIKQMLNGLIVHNRRRES